MPLFIFLPHSSQEKVQHTFLSHCDVRGIGEVYKFSHHLGADITQGDLWGLALFEAAGEHRSEVGATGGQNHLVYLDKRNKRNVLEDTETMHFYTWLNDWTALFYGGLQVTK